MRLRDAFRCVLCGGSNNLAAHHIARKSFLRSARFETGNGITLCGACHREPHEGFNGKPDFSQPMDAQSGEKIDLMAALYGALADDGSRRGILRDDYYFLSDRTLGTFKRFQGFDPDDEFPGALVWQAHLVWRQSSLHVMSALLEANGFGGTVLDGLLEGRGIRRARRGED